MKTKTFTLTALIAVLLMPLVLAGQEGPALAKGTVEFGGRHVWGDVYGRPDLPFEPSLTRSKFNEYRDLRDSFFVRNLNVRNDGLFGTRNYFHAQSQSTAQKDRSVLATFGQPGRFKVQFRWDETPHTLSNTTRTLFSRSAPGIFTVSPTLRTLLQNTPSANIPAIGLAQVAGMSFITPGIHRKAGSGLASIDLKPNWNLAFSFSRENMVGSRPLGLIMNSGPSASATGGYGAELPEPIDYFTNNVKVGTEYGRSGWGLQFGYTGSFFQNNIGAMILDNPYRATDCRAAVTPTLCTNATQGPARAQVDLYPDNRAHYLDLAGAFNLTHLVRFMGAVDSGWFRQNDAFLPYTTNTAINLCGDGTQACSSTSVLPATSLHGEKQTLAMNYTIVTLPWKKLQLKAAYRHFDYNNNTKSLDMTPVIGDMGLPDLEEPEDSHIFGYNKKNLDLTGVWSFAKHSSAKIGYEGEWLDRSTRDVAHSMEHSLISALDLSPRRDLLIRVSYRHQNREPEKYDDMHSDGIPCDAAALQEARADFEMPEVQPCQRRFDEAARIRNRGDVLVQYSPADKLSFSASAGTTQDDYNRRGGSNSTTPLNFLTGSAATASPYYLYGMLKDLSHIYTADGNYVVSKWVTAFAEYSHEQYHRRMTSRYRTPSGCGPNSAGVANAGPCDTANNDWESRTRDFADVYSTGLDFTLGKKVSLSTWYSLADSKSHVLSRALGTQPANFLTNPTPANNSPDRFMMTTTSAATDYPETVSRVHDVSAIVTFKLTKNIMPRIEYRYQQFDNKDYQTSAMTPFMGCVALSGVPASGGSPAIGPTAAPGCPTLGPTLATPISSPLYPYTAVGDTAAARYLFLGADTPSYHAHMLAISFLYQF